MKKLQFAGLFAGFAIAAVLIQGFSGNGISAVDEEAIIQTALDYIDGYYEGNAERMARAVHPDLAKRIVATDGNSDRQFVQNMTAERLVEITKAGGGKRLVEREGRQSDVTVLDVFHDVATVKIIAITWIDYLHVAKVDGEWKIINVLWAMKPSE